MRDLYRRIKVAPDATTQEINRALEGCRHPQLRGDAAQVLLPGMRRRQYDTVRNRLHDIGALRRATGLTQTANWRGNTARDFTNRSKLHWMRRLWPAIVPIGIVLFGLSLGIPQLWDAFQTSTRPTSGLLPATPLTVNGSQLAPLILENQSDLDSCLVFTAVTAQSDQEPSYYAYYLRSHDKQTLNIPKGIYTLSYALGHDWQGAESLFKDEPHLRSVHPKVKLKFESTPLKEKGYALRIGPKGQKIYAKDIEHSIVDL